MDTRQTASGARHGAYSILPLVPEQGGGRARKSLGSSGVCPERLYPACKSCAREAGGDSESEAPTYWRSAQAMFAKATGLPADFEDGRFSLNSDDSASLQSCILGHFGKNACKPARHCTLLHMLEAKRHQCSRHVKKPRSTCLVAIGLSWVEQLWGRLSASSRLAAQSSCCSCRKPPPLSADPRRNHAALGPRWQQLISSVGGLQRLLVSHQRLPMAASGKTVTINKSRRPCACRADLGARACKIASSDISGRMPASQPATALYGTCLKLSAINIHVVLRNPHPPAWLQLSFPGSPRDAVAQNVLPKSSQLWLRLSASGLLRSEPLLQLLRAEL